ncbi:hypothetical protein IID27_03120 [Patescibacteria group bacterium]|nr:hypothetical protein [Patescibacteria group bacterium]
MKILFNQTFFKFLFGFLAIIIISFAILSLVDYYEKNNISGEEVFSNIE